MKSHKRNFLFVLISMIVWSCEDPFFEEDPANNPVNNFEILWNRMNDRYSFFDYKRVDWDSVYRVYRPQVNDQMSSQALFDVMQEMLNTLRDAHVNLRTDFDISYYNYYEDAPRNFRFQDVENTYLKESLRVTGFMWNGIIDSVGYIHYGSFQLPIEEQELDFVVERFKGLKGLIIDIRDNEGGDPLYGFRLARRIAKERTHIYTTVYKNGTGKDDFTAPSEAFLDINEEAKFDLPIVLLTNRVTYSAGNFFTAMLQALPDVTVVGDTTGGGGGVPLGWELPNGWYFNFSNSITYLPDGFIIEDGIPPDIQVDITDEHRLEGRDTILERALSLFSD
ncbi:MAG: S41 family peptidase [Ekhidna sp.]|nr:S41 family peptidase [Ekhidna sp.]